MTVSLIVGHDDKLGIGSTKKPGMLWHISADFKNFRKITLNHPIIMGRKTHEAIGRVLPDRANIIITRNLQYSAPGCQVVASLEQAIALAKSQDDKEIFIIGGGQVYQEAMAKNLVDRLYVTRVQGEFKADVFFPDYSHFKLLKRQEGREGKYRFSFLELVK